MLCQLNNWIIQNVNTIPQNNVNFIVNNVTFQFVQAAYPLENILGTNLKRIFLKNFGPKKKFWKRLQDIENSIFPKYEEAASNIQIQKADCVDSRDNLLVAE